MEINLLLRVVGLMKHRVCCLIWPIFGRENPTFVINKRQSISQSIKEFFQLAVGHLQTVFFQTLCDDGDN